MPKQFAAMRLALAAVLSLATSLATADEPSSAPPSATTQRAKSRQSLRDPAEQPAPTPADVTIAAVGDILFGRYAPDKTYLRVPRDPDPFVDVAPLLQSADLAFANLENPVLDEPPNKAFAVFRRMTFRASPSDLPLLTAAGFDLVSLANNHMFNMRARGVAATVEHVAAAGLRAGGAGVTPEEAMRPVVIDVRGIRVAFLMFTVWNNTGKSGFTKDGSVAFFDYEAKLEALAAAEVRAARRYLRADFVVVSMHWGREYEPHPHKGQERFAAAMRAAGADLLLGHHPHVIQDIRHDGPFAVAFSLGNFLFDNPRRDQRETLVLTATLSSPGPLRHVSWVAVQPLIADRRTHTLRYASGPDGARWRKRLATLVQNVAILPAEAPPPRPGPTAQN